MDEPSSAPTMTEQGSEQDRQDGQISEIVAEERSRLCNRSNFRRRVDERREQMTPEERGRFRQGMRSGGGGQTTPLDSTPGA
jgi:hypothetical protein